MLNRTVVGFGQKFSDFNYNRTIYGWDFVPLFPKNIIDALPRGDDFLSKYSEALYGSYTHAEGSVAWINHEDNSVELVDENRLKDISDNRSYPNTGHHESGLYLSALFNDLSSQDQGQYRLNIPV